MKKEFALGMLLVGGLLTAIYPLKVNATDVTVPAQPASTEEIINAQTTETTESTATEEATEDSDDTSYEETVGTWSEDKTSFVSNGENVTGWHTIEGKRYYFTQKGKLYTKKGMQTIDEKTYYFDDEHFVRSGVISSGDDSYYFKKKSGERVDDTGVNKIDGVYYCFAKDHSLKTGWYRDDNDERYYFDKSSFEGLTGWNYVGKFKYYFNKKAQLQQDVRDILTKKQKKSYFIRVNRTGSVVTVYAKDGAKGYTIPVVAFLCSAGKDTPTGKFKIKDKLRWHELMGPCWGQWCMHLTVDILFHSVYYDREKDNKSLNTAAYNKLGTMASHGCVRMAAGDCKWIYDNCKVGTKVEIYNNKKKPGPFDKPKIKKLKAGQTYDPTDPAFDN